MNNVLYVLSDRLSPVLERIPQTHKAKVGFVGPRLNSTHTHRRNMCALFIVDRLGAVLWRACIVQRRFRSAAAELTRWKLSWSFAFPQLRTACTVSAGM